MGKLATVFLLLFAGAVIGFYAGVQACVAYVQHETQPKTLEIAQ